MKGLHFIVVATLVYSTVALSAQEGPSTKIEEFQSKHGSVIVKGYTVIGEVSSSLGTVEVQTREIVNASSTNVKVAGLLLKTTGSGRSARESRSFVDSDEIDGLIKGVDYLSRISKDVTKHASFEAEYTTKSGFSITVFNSADGELHLAIKAGRSGESVFIKMEDLSKLKQLLMDAKAKL